MATVCAEQFSAINGRMDALSQQVNSLGSTGPSPSTQAAPASTSTLEEITGVQSTSWADRSINNPETDDDSVLVFPEEDTDLTFELEKRPNRLECQVFSYYPTGQRKQDVGMCEHVHSTSDL